MARKTPPIPEIPAVPKPMGRPRIWTEDRALTLVDTLQQWAEADATNVTLEMGLTHLGHRPWLLANIQSDHPDYRIYPQAVQCLKSYLHAKISNGALLGVYNPRFAQFYMSAQAGWTGKTESQQTITGTMNHTGLTVNFVEHQQSDSTSIQ